VPITCGYTKGITNRLPFLHMEVRLLQHYESRSCDGWHELVRTCRYDVYTRELGTAPPQRLQRCQVDIGHDGHLVADVMEEGVLVLFLLQI